jgi:hypothetical protein
MNHRIFATDGFCLIIMLFLVRLLAMLDPLRHVHDVFAHETETKPDLTNLLSTKAMTVDIAFLGKVYNTTSNLIEATKDFYIEHFPANHFRTQDLSINNRSMDDIRPTLDYVVKVTSLDPDIDPSACAFHKDTIAYCGHFRTQWCYSRADVPCDPMYFRDVLYTELARTHDCAIAVTRLLHRVNTLFPRKPFWTRVWERLWGTPRPFIHNPDHPWVISHSDQISARENTVQSDELRQRLRAYTSDLAKLHSKLTQALPDDSRLLKEYLRDSHVALHKASVNARVVLEASMPDDEILRAHWRGVKSYWTAVCTTRDSVAAAQGQSVAPEGVRQKGRRDRS